MTFIKNRLYRKEQIASLIQNSLAQVFMQKRIWNLEHLLISITRVKMSADLKIANCYVIPSNNMQELAIEAVIAQLTEYRGVIRQQLKPVLTLRYLPELRFFYDEGFDNLLAVEEIFNQHIRDSNND